MVFGTYENISEDISFSVNYKLLFKNMWFVLVYAVHMAFCNNKK